MMAQKGQTARNIVGIVVKIYAKRFVAQMVCHTIATSRAEGADAFHMSDI